MQTSVYSNIQILKGTVILQEMTLSFLLLYIDLLKIKAPLSHLNREMGTVDYNGKGLLFCCVIFVTFFL